MIDETPGAYPQLAYLFKVLAGIAVLVIVVLAALWLPLTGIPPIEQRWLLVVLLTVAVALVPYVRSVYGRMDELQKLLHQNASVAALSLLASASFVVGILQANHIVPLYNQFWTFGFIVVAWGFNLMLADRRLK